eukprot:7279810-Lingulodinium_polyedra.AAC.1
MVAPQARTALRTSSGSVHHLGTAAGSGPAAALHFPRPAAGPLRPAPGSEHVVGPPQGPGRARTR